MKNLLIYLVIVMYEEIEKIIVRTLSPFEYERLEELKTRFSENQIISAYKQYGDKPINYISKVVNTFKQTPEWLNREIVNEPLDDETKKDFEEFRDFLEVFRNEEFNKKNKNEN